MKLNLYKLLLVCLLLFANLGIQAQSVFSNESKGDLGSVIPILVMVLITTAIVLTYRSKLSHAKSRMQSLEEQVDIYSTEVNEQIAALERSEIEINLQEDEISRQKQVIEGKDKQLEEQEYRLEVIHQNISTLTAIGQAITAELLQENIISTLYKRVNLLMDAEGFGIGIFQPAEEEIIFNGYIENGKALPTHASPYCPKIDLSSWCILKQQSILINNLEKEGQNYVEEIKIVEGEIPKSLIYVPFKMSNGQRGVVTVQSFKEDAYRPKDLALLKNLSVYIAISLVNAENYRSMQEITETVQNKNRKIMDSLRYAETIQHTILPLPSLLEQHFEDYFITYQSKDVVSGDFYWFTQAGQYTFMVVVDCTGHGVPGAFMSLIGHNCLDRLIHTERITEPALILEEMHELVHSLLQQEKQLNNDSMDIGLCRMSASEKGVEVVYAGARRPLWVVDDFGQLNEIKGTRRSIGGWTQKEGAKPFEQHHLILDKGTALYMFTDGLADQHNEDKQKFGTAYLNKVIRELAMFPMDLQKQEVERIWNSFKDETPQRDDVTLIGWRV